MRPLLTAIRKELLLLSRDLHGLLLLFLMPTVFILIMSLALQNTFGRHTDSVFDVLVEDTVGTDASRTLLAHLHDHTAFHWQLTEDPDAARDAVARDAVAFRLRILPGTDAGALQLQADVAPATGGATTALFEAALREGLGRQQMDQLLTSLADSGLMETPPDGLSAVDEAVQLHYLAGTDGQTHPTSVQQSVPAWLVFAMFFSVVPLSNTLIRERQQGTLRRLRTLPLSPAVPILGKLMPYFLINQLQVILMLAVGVYLVPLLGGDRLTLGQSPGGLALMAASISLAALGYSILIAVLARTTEQATILGGTGNIILAALGGVMVPRFIMPDTMQHISWLSPMAWGLEGFLDVFLRQGDWRTVLPEARGLALFGLGAAALAIGLEKRTTA